MIAIASAPIRLLASTNPDESSSAISFIPIAFLQSVFRRASTNHRWFYDKQRAAEGEVFFAGFPSWMNTHSSGVFPGKVIAVGKGLGYVDMWKGILYRNVLQENVTAKFFPLPNPLPNNQKYYHGGHHFRGGVPARSPPPVVLWSDVLRWKIYTVSQRPPLMPVIRKSIQPSRR